MKKSRMNNYGNSVNGKVFTVFLVILGVVFGYFLHPIIASINTSAKPPEVFASHWGDSKEKIIRQEGDNWDISQSADSHDVAVRFQNKTFEGFTCNPEFRLNDNRLRSVYMTIEMEESAYNNLVSKYSKEEPASDESDNITARYTLNNSDYEIHSIGAGTLR